MALAHNVNSTAREGRIPGTINLNATENEETGYGQSLYPIPSSDPNDPLQWPRWKKNTVLIICIAYSYLGCSAVFGTSPYISLWSKEFGVSFNTAASLINYPSLAYGFSSILMVPAYHKLGRRPVMLLSLVLYCLGLMGASLSHSYNGLMGARIVQAFGSGICEAIPIQLVNDIFFLHQRGAKIAFCCVALSFGGAGPLFAGFLLKAGLSWRPFFYCNLGMAVALLATAFIFVEESRFDRPKASAAIVGIVQEVDISSSNSSAPGEKTAIIHTSKTASTSTATSSNEELAVPTPTPNRRSFASRLNPLSPIDHSAPFFSTILRAFTYLLIPSNLWVITTYGCYIGLVGLSVNYTFPIRIMEAPYNWPESSSGMIAMATIVGLLLSLPFASVSDRVAAWLTKRNNGVREAEMRLGTLFPSMVLCPVALALYGVAAARGWPWFVFFFCQGLVQFAATFYFTVTLAYAVDSYPGNLSELLICQNVGKTLIGFGMGYKVLDWVQRYGYIRVISGAFAGLLLVNNLFTIVFMLYGKRVRQLTSRSWLARLHARTVVEGEVH